MHFALLFKIGGQAILHYTNELEERQGITDLASSILAGVTAKDWNSDPAKTTQGPSRLA